MAHFFPSLEQISLLKEPPTAGEWELLYYLESHLSDDYEVYFQPYFNGLRPDIAIMRKDWGVIIIEVKDWNLNSYEVDEKNEWRLKQNQTKLRSPFQQVFSYKKSLFDLHINGLAEKKLRNHNFYNILKPFVYFHGSSKTDIYRIFAAAERQNKKNRDELNAKIETGNIEQRKYDKQMEYLDNKTRQINRDRGITLHHQNLSKLQKALDKHVLFHDDIYKEFKRYLQPPFHTTDQGRTINYGKLQRRLIKSAPGFQKIKGVPGSGKTTVLAKRAVNAHKRHGDRVLILTFNLALKNFIHDKISEVRENFSWGKFDIISYHHFIRDARNMAGVPEPKSREDYFEKFYADEEMFEGCDSGIPKYKTILIDEVQDFEKPWIKIIRKCFLADDSEMILFGDEGQNIYERHINKANPEIIRGFGEWERLTISYRSGKTSPLTSMVKAYQTEFLVSKYDIDTTESHHGFLSLDILQNHVLDPIVDWVKLANFIFKFMKTNIIHPNDLCVLAAEVAPLRKIDNAYKLISSEETNTTFERQETYDALASLFDKRFKHTKFKLRQKYPRKSDAEIKKAELEQSLEKVRRSKKYHFWSNRGTLKLSTVHSFKGFEAQNIIYILGNNDSVELVYAGITRSRRNLLTFSPPSTKYSKFIEAHLARGTHVTKKPDFPNFFGTPQKTPTFHNMASIGTSEPESGDFAPTNPS